MNKRKQLNMQKSKGAQFMPIPKYMSIPEDMMCTPDEYVDSINHMLYIMDTNQRAERLHGDITKLASRINQYTKSASSEIEQLLKLLGERDIEDVCEHSKQVINLNFSVRAYMSSFRKAVDVLENADLSFLDEGPEPVEDNSPELSAQLVEDVSNSVEPFEVNGEVKRIISQHKINEFCQLYCDGGSKDFVQQAEEIKSISAEICEKCEEAIAQCFSCCVTYDAEISNVRERQLQKMLLQSDANREVCAEYHRRANTIINEQVLACGSDKQAFVNALNDFMDKYKNAYDKCRNDSITAIEICGAMKAEIKTEDARANADQQQSKNKKNKKQPLSAEAKTQIGEVSNAEKLIESNANRARVDFRLDSNDVKSRADAIAVAFQQER